MSEGEGEGEAVEVRCSTCGDLIEVAGSGPLAEFDARSEHRLWWCRGVSTGLTVPDAWR